MESVCIQESACPHHRKRSSSPVIRGRLRGVTHNSFPRLRRKWRAQRAEGGVPPPVIDTDIFILHPRRNGVQYTITKIHAKKERPLQKSPRKKKNSFLLPWASVQKQLCLCLCFTFHIVTPRRCNNRDEKCCHNNAGSNQCCCCGGNWLKLRYHLGDNNRIRYRGTCRT